MTVTGGVGNTMGWVGGQAERHFANSRFSIFGGLGYLPDVPGYIGVPEGWTAAAGLRGYTPGTNHRGFLELSVSQIAFEAVEATFPRPANVEEGDRVYGPGLSVGYQYLADGGLTFVSSAGVGYGGGSTESGYHGLVSVGLGYTWWGSRTEGRDEMRP